MMPCLLFQHFGNCNPVPVLILARNSGLLPFQCLLGCLQFEQNCDVLQGWECITEALKQDQHWTQACLTGFFKFNLLIFFPFLGNMKAEWSIFFKKKCIPHFRFPTHPKKGSYYGVSPFAAGGQESTQDAYLSAANQGRKWMVFSAAGLLQIKPAVVKGRNYSCLMHTVVFELSTRPLTQLWQHCWLQFGPT